VGYTVSVGVPAPRVVLDSDATGLGSDGEALAAMTFDVMDHCGVARPVDVGMGGVGVSVQTDSVVKTRMS
jgi:hypothetical protein